MPMYLWKCRGCDTEEQVWRSVDDIEEGPEEACPVCGGTDWRRIMCAAINRWRFND